MALSQAALDERQKEFSNSGRMSRPFRRGNGVMSHHDSRAPTSVIF